MKYCKKCLKTFDDSWFTCLSCNGELIIISKEKEAEELKRIQGEVYKRINSGIQQCSICKNEFKKEELSKPTPNKPLSLGIWGFIYRICFLENPESLMCVECDKKRFGKQNKFKNTFYLAVGIPLAVLWIVWLIQKILK